MRWRHTLMTLIGSLALAVASGCTVGGGFTGGGGGGDGGPGGNTPSAGQTEFTNNILPMVRGCAGTGVGCHTGAGTDPAKFLGAGPEGEYYTTLVSYAQIHGNWSVTDAGMVTKLSSDAATVGSHFGFQPWSTDQLAKLEAWFSLEEERLNEPGGGGGGVDTRTLFAEWSGCMDLQIWEETQMGTWAEKATPNGSCANCHDRGQYWIHINSQSELMFQMNQYELFIPGFFAATLADGGKIVPATDKLIRVGDGNPTGSPHPVFNTDLLNDPYFIALENFYQATMQRKTAGTPTPCGPAQFPMPTPMM